MDYTLETKLDDLCSDLFQLRINFWNYDSFRHLIGLLGQGTNPSQYKHIYTCMPLLGSAPMV